MIEDTELMGELHMALDEIGWQEYEYCDPDELFDIPENPQDMPFLCLIDWQYTTNNSPYLKVCYWTGDHFSDFEDGCLSGPVRAVRAFARLV